jgi:alanyl aminopeptidase
MPIPKRLVLAAFALLAAAGAGLPAEKTPQPGRLGRDVVPAFEAVSLVLDPSKAEYTGSVRVNLVVMKRTSSFSFHAKDLELGRIVLSDSAGQIGFTQKALEGGRVELTTRRPLAPGPHQLEIDFRNDFNSRAASLYRMETGGHAYAFTQFESTDARGAFPCWDEPSFKIPWRITLTVPSGHMAVSNTPVEKETQKGGMKTVVFKDTRPLPSYLLAMATGPLDSVPIPGLSVPGRVITVKGASGLAGEAVRTTPLLLKALEFYFARPYPYEKLDLIAVPEFWPGAMENPGAITFADQVLLVDPKAASVGQRRHLAEVTAHELAHMWFGDLVTMEWWDDLWLNESFASWMGNKVTDEVFPDFNVAIASVQGTQKAMLTDALLAARAVRQPVASEENLDQLADELAYQKGRAVLEMVESWIGPKTFRKGVLRYLEEHEWGNANAGDLWGALSATAGFDLGAVMSTFLDQPGVPLVQVEVTEDNRMRLSQRRFLNHGTQGAPPATWMIPIEVRYSDGSETHTLGAFLTQPEAVMPLETKKPTVWLHPNADERGYYRWSAPPEFLTRLVSRASTVLEPRERVGLVGNLGALLQGGVLHGDDYLRLLAPLAADPQPEVVKAVAAGLHGVRRAFVASGVEEAFAAYVRRVLGPALERIGLDKRADEPEAVTALRPSLVAWLGDEGRDPQVREHAGRVARAWLADPSAVDPTLAGTALEVAALDGDRALFEEYRKRFEATTIPAERARYLSALGAFRDPALVEEALAYALKGPLRPQEVFAIPAVVASASPAQEERVYRWMTESYASLTSRMPPTVAATYLPYFASGCSAERLAAARSFFADPARNLPGTEAELTKVGEVVKSCVELREREGRAVSAYLQSATRGE